MDEPTFVQKMQQLSVNYDMRNLSALLSEDELGVLNSFFKKKYQTDFSQLGILKPLILMSMKFNKGLECDAKVIIRWYLRQSGDMSFSRDGQLLPFQEEERNLNLLNIFITLFGLAPSVPEFATSLQKP